MSAMTVAAVVGMSAAVHANSDWTQVVTVAEAGGTSGTLTFGVSPTGTAGIDAALNEVVQPPPPPAGNFDRRFSDNGGLVVNIVSGLTADLASTTMGLSVQRAAAGNITLTWDNAALAGKASSAVLQDQFGGVLGVNVNMLTAGTVTITSAAISALNIIFTSLDGILPPNHTQLVFVGTPPTTATDLVALGAITVAPQTAGGAVSATTVSVTASKVGAGTLSGTLTVVAAAGGNAVFSNLVYDAAAGPGGTEAFTVVFTANNNVGAAITVTTASITASVPNVVTPTLVPVAGAENLQPLLSWGAQATALSYKLSFGTDPGCTSILNAFATTATSYQQPTTLANGNYCWNVTSVGAAGAQSAPSANSTFVTIPTFGEWGMIFLVVSMAGGGAWYLRRRVAVAA